RRRPMPALSPRSRPARAYPAPGSSATKNENVRVPGCSPRGWGRNRRRAAWAGLDRPPAIRYAPSPMRTTVRHLFAATLAVVLSLCGRTAFAQMKVAVVDLQRAVMQTEDGLRA